jgi:transcriptional regulator
VTIYIPPYFKGDDATARRLIAAYPFATLITPAAGDVHVTHLPLLLEGDALTGHVARPNPHWNALEAADSIAVFHGPHAFVSRGWYEHPSDNVPTWNYATVHVTGRAQLMPVAGNREVVERIAERFEPAGTPPTAAAKLDRLPAGVVAFRLPLARVEVKVKMNQNKTAADRRGVIAGLRATGGAEELAVANWMQAHEPG